MSAEHLHEIVGAAIALAGFGVGWWARGKR